MVSLVNRKCSICGCGTVCGCRAAEGTIRACGFAVIPLKLDYELATLDYSYHDYESLGPASAFYGYSTRDQSPIFGAGSGVYVDDCIAMGTHPGQGTSPCVVLAEGYRQEFYTDGSRATKVVFDTLTDSGLPWVDTYTDNYTMSHSSRTGADDAFYEKDRTAWTRRTVLKFSAGGHAAIFATNTNFDASPGPFPPASTLFASFGSVPSTYEEATIAHPEQAASEACEFPLEGSDSTTRYARVAHTEVNDVALDRYFVADASWSSFNPAPAGQDTGDFPNALSYMRLSETTVSVDPTPTNPGGRDCSRAYQVSVDAGPLGGVTGLFLQLCVRPENLPDAPRDGYPFAPVWAYTDADSVTWLLSKGGPLLWYLYQSGVGGGYAFKATPGCCPRVITEIAPLYQFFSATSWSLVQPTFSIAVADPPEDYECICEPPCSRRQLASSTDQSAFVAFYDGQLAPAGDYKVKYLGGAYNFGGSGDPRGSPYFKIESKILDASGALLVRMGIGDDTTDQVGFARIAQIEAAHAGDEWTFTLAAPAELRLYLDDDPSYDNSPDMPPETLPRFEVCPVAPSAGVQLARMRTKIGDAPAVSFVTVAALDFDGPAKWQELHQYALAYAGDAAAAATWLTNFTRSLSGLDCDCRAHWARWVASFPPVLTDADSFFAWTVDGHNAVNRRLEKSEMSLAAARARWD